MPLSVSLLAVEVMMTPLSRLLLLLLSMSLSAHVLSSLAEVMMATAAVVVGGRMGWLDTGSAGVVVPSEVVVHCHPIGDGEVNDALTHVQSCGTVPLSSQLP